MEATATNMFGQIRLLSVTLTSHSLANGAFPKVTIANFDRRAGDAGELSDTTLLYYFPIVTEDQREDWEQYSWDNQGWIYKDWLTHKGERFFETNPGNISRKIYGFHQALEILQHDPDWPKAIKKAHWDSINSDLALAQNLGPPSPVVGTKFYLPMWQIGKRNPAQRDPVN